MLKRWQNAIAAAVCLCVAIYLYSLGMKTTQSESNERFSFRIVANKVSFLRECRENFSDEPCEDYTFLTVSGKNYYWQKQVEMPILRQRLPLPIWNRVLFAASTPESSRCTMDLVGALDRWLEVNLAKAVLSHIEILPEEVSPCLRLVDHGSGKLISHQFWIFQRGRTAATLTCDVIGSFPNPGCMLTAYVAKGEYTIKLGHMPARMGRSLLEQSPQLIEMLRRNLPENAPDSVKRVKLEEVGELSPNAEKVLSELENGLK